MVCVVSVTVSRRHGSLLSRFSACVHSSVVGHVGRTGLGQVGHVGVGQVGLVHLGQVGHVGHVDVGHVAHVGHVGHVGHLLIKWVKCEVTGATLCDAGNGGGRCLFGITSVVDIDDM